MREESAALSAQLERDKAALEHAHAASRLLDPDAPIDPNGLLERYAAGGGGEAEGEGGGLSAAQLGARADALSAGMREEMRSCAFSLDDAPYSADASAAAVTAHRAAGSAAGVGGTDAGGPGGADSGICAGSHANAAAAFLADFPLAPMEELTAVGGGEEGGGEQGFMDAFREQRAQ